MTTTIPCEDPLIISLPEYVDFCCHTDNLEDPDVTLDTAYMLRRLANNPQVLVVFLNEQLKHIDQYRVKTDFTPPSFYLYQSSRFSVRAVLWLPSHEEDESYAAKGYGVTHNHHFNFLTCGYYGPGYRTVIYDFDSQQCAGLIGERVSLQWKEDTILSRGKLMHYRHSRDVHIQYPPESLSLSLNLVFPSHPNASIQYAFDLDTQTISGHLDVLPTTSILMMVAERLHDQNTVTQLEKISLRHCCPRTRAMSYKTLMKINHDDYDRYKQRQSNDSSRYVREIEL